jgi:iron complex transport system substrate-binding protein
VSAIRHHRVVAVDDSVASRWGPRIVDFARAIAKVARQS